MRVFLLVLITAVLPNLLLALPNRAHTDHKLKPSLAEHGVVSFAPHGGVSKYKAMVKSVAPRQEQAQDTGIGLGWLFLGIAAFSVLLLRMAVEVETIASQYRTYWTF